MLKGIFYWWLHVHDERVSDLNFGFLDSGFKIYIVFFILFFKVLILSC